MTRRALSVGVGSFGGRRDALPFAPELAERLRTALGALGYECTEPAPLTGEDLGTAVHQTISAAAPDDVLVIHVISHGQTADGTGRLYVVGPDGRHHPLGDVESWLAAIEDHGSRPPTLFLLDVCQAGQAARLPWQGLRGDGSNRAWVLGAAAPGRSAYDGRLTRALVHVLEALGRGELDIDPALEHAPFTAVARAVRLEVDRLTAADDGDSQQVTGSLLDVTADPPDLPFFPNPAYPPSPARRARAEVDAAVAPFLDDVDEALDAAHFYERASGHRAAGSGAAGCFSGRRAELRTLVPWLVGHGTGALRVVTGSPGVGKSALLGVLVCAAHPRLRSATKEVWNRIEQAPWQLDRLAAVHARQRGLAEITASVGRQLGLPATSPADLTRALAGLPEAPAVVLDALDEADHPVEVLADLLLPLAAALRPDGSPACRLLVGTRPWGFEELLDLARTGDGLLDLDQVDRGVLRGELETYVSELLRAHPGYLDAGAVRGAFAAEVAKTLAAPPAEGEERWGEFLVAGLYTQHFATDGAEAETDPVRAAATGRRVPRTLPQVFELDLGGHTGTPWLRPVLTALAFARGEGMPATVAARCAPLFGAEFARLPSPAAPKPLSRSAVRITTVRALVEWLEDSSLGEALNLLDRRAVSYSVPWPGLLYEKLGLAAEHGEKDLFHVLRTARIRLPPADGAGKFRSTSVDGRVHVVAYSRPSTRGSRTMTFAELAAAWPDRSWSLMVDQDSDHEIRLGPGAVELLGAAQRMVAEMPARGPVDAGDAPADAPAGRAARWLKYAAPGPAAGPASDPRADPPAEDVPFIASAVPAPAEVSAALAAARFYLRRSTDTDGTTLYRLFHAGLAEHLRGRAAGGSAAESALLDALLAPLSSSPPSVSAPADWAPAGSAPVGPAPARAVTSWPRRRWDLAEPYVLRHAAEHATLADRLPDLLGDVEFLLRADGLAELPERDWPDGDLRSLFLWAWRVPPPRRRSLLALHAVRWGRYDLASLLDTPPGAPPLTWRPWWAAVPRDRDPRRNSAYMPGPVVPTGVVRVGKEHAVVAPHGKGWVVALSLQTAELLGELRTGGVPVTEIEPGMLGDRPAVLLRRGEESPWLWDVPAGRIEIPAAPSGTPPRQVGVTVVVGVHPVTVTGNPDGTLSWRSMADDRISHDTPAHQGTVRAVTGGRVDGRTVVLTGGDDGVVRVWDAVSRRQLDRIDQYFPVGALELTPDGYLVVTIGDEVICFRYAGAARRNREGY
ncbi:caspase family protein [Actinomadura craniellae]|uniref:caspase family protein n=1 Tax=Actinomadura craniellae TaxID=2231787 RepID=UPI0022777079|nr:caspase family protein [Actinomadura craniellae]